MASSARPPACKQSEISKQECRAVLYRAAHSKFLEKAVRSRELLTFLCTFALDHEHEPLSEQAIGKAVFGRETGYDTTVDTIARVQVSQLRKKLKEYFSSEGSEEPIVIDIPPGSYIPTFTVREISRPVASPVLPAAVPPAPMIRKDFRSWKYAAVTFFVLFCLTMAWGLSSRYELDRRTPSAGAPWDTFWKPFVASGRDLPIVVSDANLMIVSRMLGRLVTLHEYRNPNYPQSLIDQFADQKTRDMAKTILGNYYTGTQDTRVVNDFAPLAVRYGTALVVVPAREFRLAPGAAGNTVIIGHNHGNPWFELFDTRMNFHYVWPIGAETPVIANRHPLPGEKAAYDVVFQKSGYCVVAFQPRPDGHGDALLIIGTDLSSLDAGGRFMTEPNWLRTLYKTLHADGSRRMPYFEILLKTDLLNSVSPEFHIVTSRVSVERPN